MAQIVPVTPEPEGKPHDLGTQEEPEHDLRVKIPWVAYYVGLKRAKHFSKFAIAALICVTCISVVKYLLTLNGEIQVAKAGLLRDTESLSMTIKARIENDFFALDSVANHWSQRSDMDRPQFRKYITSPFFNKSLSSMTTAILLHRVKDSQRDVIEQETGSLKLRSDCCHGSVYDADSAACNLTAEAQCSLPDGRFHFVCINMTTKVKDRCPRAQEYVVVMYQEPFEKNPGPMGFNMLSHPGRESAWLEAIETGQKAATKRVKRVYASQPEWGMLVWNPVFVDEETSGNQTFFDSPELFKKSELEAMGRRPYALGSVSGVYLLQRTLLGAVQDHVSSLQDVRLHLFDRRNSTKPDESLLAVFDPQLSHEEMYALAWEDQGLTPKMVKDRSHNAVQVALTIGDSTLELLVVVEPNENWEQRQATSAPWIVLGVSLALGYASQLERWVGHPEILSAHALIEAKKESYTVRAVGG
mmetsp:Transcript_89955/g.160100  ORF Transcript_89955/g.160100 Transcript_89955/m.160100 type:complete len:472 (-) Transcript_89955:160-1575(-)